VEIGVILALRLWKKMECIHWKNTNDNLHNSI
jgi:hypothetical protein